MIAFDRTRQVAPQIAEILRERILKLDYPPRGVLSRSALQLEFGVSQTPVRDALQHLADEGLVHIFPQSSTIVAPIDIGLAMQGHFLRSAVEIEAVRKIAGDAGPDLVQALRRIIASQTRWSEDGDFAAFDEEDRAFHKKFYDAAGISTLWTIVRRHSAHLDRLRRLNLPRPGKMASVLADHTAIVDALEARDVEGATVAMRRHLSGTVALVETMAAENPGYVEMAPGAPPRVATA